MQLLTISLLAATLLITTTTTQHSKSFTITKTPSGHSIAYPPYVHINVKQSISDTKHTIAESQAATTNTRDDHQERESTNRTKLDLLHRDKLPPYSWHRDRKHRLAARLKRDARRVGTLISLTGAARRRRTPQDEEGGGDDPYRASGFGSEVVSGMDQGSGEYFVRIGVGSPARSQYVVVDSGSDIVWVQCQPCTQCYHQSDPVFDPDDSASFAGVSCGSAACERAGNSGCHEGRCRYEVSYGDGSIGRTVVQNVAIGCGHTNRGMFVGAAGLLGLGGGSMSLVGQLGGETGGAFSYCLVSRGSYGSSGSLEFGRSSLPVGAAWVPLLRNLRAPSFYYVGLSGLGVGGSRVPIPEDAFALTESGEGGVVMDTGTAVTRLPEQAYAAFRDAFAAETGSLPRAQGVSIFDTCYDLSGFVTVRVPTVSFLLSGGPVLTLPASNFLIPVDEKGTFCFAFAASPSSLSIIGNIQQEGIQISFDGANGYVGFGPNVC